ncbi:AAA family ATPase [uncultured Legionella sp.]|uniref:AAA family ATPase n=1 Tax=uncultured Legionella sp. TaxID=210934 RepID=UPI0026350039|nr:AAA family ATPase [uncultured Legionella sp.]
MIVFLFGLPGVGKTYIGQLLQKELGACYWDADEALTEEMKLAVRNEQAFSRTMTTELASTIIEKMKLLEQNNEFIIVSQAMLRETDRHLFREQFSDLHFIYIRCERDHTSQRIAQRADFVTVSYFEKLTAAFEPHRKDAETYPIIDNYKKTDEQLIKAFNELLNIKPKTIWQLDFFPELTQQDPDLMHSRGHMMNKSL